jgi:hypothetical protein
MLTTIKNNIRKMATGLLIAVALLTSYPIQAHSAHPEPSRKEIRLEARLLKQKGKRLQQEGKDLIQESRKMKAESGNRKEARKRKKEGRQLLKTGKHIEQQGRLLKKGKIMPHLVVHC